MTVTTQALLFAAHDQRELGVGLEADHSVHHVRASFLQAVGELDIVLLIEARPHSMTTVTSLPACAASTSESTIGE